MVARGIAAPSRGKKLAANQMPSSSQQKRKHEDSCMDMCDWMSGPPMEEDAWFLSALIKLVPRLTKESRNARTIRRAENTPFTSATHTPRAPSSQPCCCCFFTKAIGNKGPRKRSLSSVAHSPSSRRPTNCLQNVHTDISEHGSIATGRFLGLLPQVCIGRGSWHDRDATDNESSSTQCQTSPVGRKSHEHVKVNLQSRRKLTRAPRRQLYRRSSQRWFDGGKTSLIFLFKAADEKASCKANQLVPSAGPVQKREDDLARAVENEGFDMRGPVGQLWARELKSTPELREQHANVVTKREDQARFRIAWAKTQLENCSRGRKNPRAIHWWTQTSECTMVSERSFKQRVAETIRPL